MSFTEGTSIERIINEMGSYAGNEEGMIHVCQARIQHELQKELMKQQNEFQEKLLKEQGKFQSRQLCKTTWLVIFTALMASAAVATAVGVLTK